VVLAALVPVFALIVLGFALKQSLMRLETHTMPVVIALAATGP
jgi:hypothetical protein